MPPDIALHDAALISSALTAAEKAASTRPVPAGGDILVVVLDTVRADRLGVYGYGEGTTPKLDEWAKHAHVWEKAWTDAPWTLPAHAAMFTGKPERETGARAVPRDDPRKAAPLPEAEVTLAERLRDAGYLTVGIAANPLFLHPSYGLSQGFDVWINTQPTDDPRGVPYLPADRVVPMAIAALPAMLTASAPSRPRFLFVNLMDAHSPYRPRSGFVSHPDRLRLRSLPGAKGYRKVAKLLLGGADVSAEIRASWSEAYDADLRFLDDQLGMLLDAAAVPHVYVLSDHGEYLGEHHLIEHAKDVYEGAVHIPFLARDPAFPPGRDGALVQTHDLAWMVLQAAGLPTDGIERTGAVAVSESTLTLKKDLTASYGSRFNRVRRAFRVGDHELIVGSDGAREVYDLAADPAQEHPAAAVPPELEGVELAWLAAHPERPTAPPDARPASESPPPDAERLKALGYEE